MEERANKFRFQQPTHRLPCVYPNLWLGAQLTKINNVLPLLLYSVSSPLVAMDACMTEFHELRHGNVNNIIAAGNLKSIFKPTARCDTD